MYKLLIKTICVLTIFIALPVTAQDNKHALPLRGINLVGAGFASSALPGRENFDYIFPSASDIKIYTDFGMEVMRLSFLWERLQPELDKPLNAQYLNGIESVVREANNHGLFVILDVHNYGAYQSKLIGSDEVTRNSFNNLWFRLATHFKDDKNVMFGIMNPIGIVRRRGFQFRKMHFWQFAVRGQRKKYLCPPHSGQARTDF